MVRLLFGLGVAVVVFTIFSLVDCALFEKTRIRGVPRAVWIIVILLLPVIGGVLWFIIGRGRRSSGGARSMAPDDDPEFLGQLGRDAAQEERIRRLEQELADLDDDKPDSTDHRDGDKPGRTDA